MYARTSLDMLELLELISILPDVGRQLEIAMAVNIPEVVITHERN